MAGKEKRKAMKAERKEKTVGADAAQGALPQGRDQLIDMNQAIEMLKTTRPTFYRWLRSGKLKGMKVGRQWRFYREEIERFLKGEGPQVALPADITPLVEILRKRAAELGMKEQPGGEADVRAVVSLMMHTSYRMRASDIHIAPHMQGGEKGGVAILRYRVDGVLHVIAEFDLRLLPAIAEHWKTLAGCNVNENRIPQDGRVLIAVHGPDGKKKNLDLRVCFLPACMGESVTARILDADAVRLQLDQFNYASAEKEKIIRAIEAPWGMVIVSGPTGSGKTTTLYACVNHVSGPEHKVMTIENPVEFFLPWTVQVQVADQRGLTFARGVRSILRSDPDVIMVGEVRDQETLMVSCQAALTGHLVLSTLHADEAARALKRMVEMGCDPFIIGDSTKLVMAQRLVRKLCRECSEETALPDNLLDQAAQFARSGGLGWNDMPKKFRKAVGCAKCGQTGYRGRIAIIEVLEVTSEIASALRRGASVDELRTIAVGQGMTTIAADGVRRAANGETTFLEVVRTLGLR